MTLYRNRWSFLIYDFGIINLTDGNIVTGSLTTKSLFVSRFIFDSFSDLLLDILLLLLLPLFEFFGSRRCLELFFFSVGFSFFLGDKASNVMFLDDFLIVMIGFGFRIDILLCLLMSMLWLRTLFLA